MRGARLAPGDARAWLTHLAVFPEGVPLLRRTGRVPALVDVVAALTDADPETTIYVSPPAPSRSEVIVCVKPGDGRSPAGFACLREVSLVPEIRDVWAEWRRSRTPSAAEAVQAVTYYGRYDAYEPVFPPS